MNYSACIFDLDGTLLNTISDLASVVNTALKFFGYPGHAVADYKKMVGEGLEKLIMYALPQNHNDGETVKKVKEVVRKEYLLHLTDTTAPYPGIPELLDKLQEREIKLAILTNKPQQMVDLSVDRLLSSWPFLAVRGMQPEIPPKPDPKAALLIAEKLRLRPSQILLVGDSDIDIQTANNAGMRPVAVTWGFRPRKELEKCRVEFIIDRPEELLRLI
jgi:phosphoglycolate phosphatase